MARLFVAAWPPSAVIDSLRALSRPDEPGVRWVREQNWHITLRFLGEAELDDVVAHLTSVALPGATVTLGPTIEHLDVRQIVVPAAGADDLAGAVHGATAELGQVDRRGFRGHLTIARTRPRAPSSTIGTPLTASWTITEVAVVASDLQPTGAVYTTVASIPTV